MSTSVVLPPHAGWLGDWKPASAGLAACRAAHAGAHPLGAHPLGDGAGKYGVEHKLVPQLQLNGQLLARCQVLQAAACACVGWVCMRVGDGSVCAWGGCACLWVMAGCAGGGGGPTGGRLGKGLAPLGIGNGAARWLPCSRRGLASQLTTLHAPARCKRGVAPQLTTRAQPVCYSQPACSAHL